MSNVTGSDSGATFMVAPEASFGSPNSGDIRDFTPPASGWLSLKVLTDSFDSALNALKMTTIETRETSLAGSVGSPVVVAPVDGSGPKKSVRGDIPFELMLRGWGGNSPDDTALGLILASSLASKIQTPGAEYTVTEDTSTIFTTSSGDIGNFASGDIINVVQANGADRFLRVTHVNSGTYKVTTETEHGIPNATTATVRLCHMWWQPDSTSTPGDSIAVQLAPADGLHTYIGIGTRLAEVEIVKDPNGSMKLRGVLRCTDGDYRAAVSATLTAPYPLGTDGTTATTPLSAAASPVLISANVAGNSPPYATTATTLKVREWAVKATVGLVEDADQGKRSRVGDLLVADAQLTGSFTTAAPTTEVDFRDVLRLDRTHSVSFQASGANDSGNGWGVWVGKITPDADPGITIAPKDRSQAVSFKAGDYAGDTGTGVAKNSRWVIFATA